MGEAAAHQEETPGEEVQAGEGERVSADEGGDREWVVFGTVVWNRERRRRRGLYSETRGGEEEAYEVDLPHNKSAQHPTSLPQVLLNSTTRIFSTTQSLL